MTRKLFSLLISCFAVFLLMGAGVEQEPAVLVDEELSQTETAAEVPEQPAEQAAPETVEPVEPADPAEESVPVVEEELDYTLTVDGQPVPKTVGKTYRSEITYVALGPMAQCLDETILTKWDEATQTMTVHNDKLVLTATVGQLYLTVNGRFFYTPEGIQMENGQVIVPLSDLAKAFDASLSWDGTTGLTSVTRGSGAAMDGELFYDAEDLFWLSRVIYTESGNQPLEGMMAVGNVVLNRVKHQFTTYWTGHIANSSPNSQSVVAAKLVLDGGVVEEVENALYFDSAANSWAARNRTCVAVIGGHKFYS